VQPRARTQKLVVQELPDEVLVYDLGRNRAHCLNGTAARVWRLCDGSHSVPALAAELSRELGTPVDEGVVWLALEQLRKARLLQAPAPAAAPASLSRRALLRRGAVAGGGALLLPLVSSITAPAAAAAASAISEQQCWNGSGDGQNCGGMANRPCAGGGICRRRLLWFCWCA
jgi:hypothetical protein